jgi:polar amino acid transport system permease protein
MTVNSTARERGEAAPGAPDDGGAIDALPLRRPGRALAAALTLAAAALFIYGAATNSNYQWGTYFAYLFDTRILAGAWITMQLTVYAMVLALVLGVVLAIMRLSSNPVLRYTAWGFLWLFRGTPVYVQLVFWGLFPSIYPQIGIGIPFLHRFATLDIQGLEAAFLFGVIGLGLNEAAYMAEIVRAGLLSVGEGQGEAAAALGMSSTQTMRRIILPQAMRVVIPPTGNELISMLKTTSLVTAVPYTLDLYSRARAISGVTFEPVPLLLVASTWYLAITSVLMCGQYFLERRFARGATRKLTAKQQRAALDLASAADGRPR